MSENMARFESRTLLKDALRPFAYAYAALVRSGFEAHGSGLMYDPRDPRMLGPFVVDLKPLHDIFMSMRAEDEAALRRRETSPPDPPRSDPAPPGAPTENIE